MSYEYVSADGLNQYSDINTEGTIVKARYLPSSLKTERGKRLIEALPLPRIESREWQAAYTIPLSQYKWDPDKPKFEKLLEIWQLKNIRFPLPFAGEIEREFYRSITDSYCSRYLSEEEVSGNITVNNTMVKQYGKIAPKKNGAVVGFSLLGSSQSGKTSALKIMTDWYPQVIEHPLDNGGRFTQIVYLNVECQVHSSMRGMFGAIGHEIDRALGNTEEIYEALFRKNRQTISQKEQLLRKLIDTFAIGALILEECQSMNFNNKDEKSFEAFLTLCNETGIALIMVGTEDARKKMFGYAARTAHRVGPEVKSDMYCENNQFLSTLILRLFEYQWFDEKVDLTPEIANELIESSHGIIGLLIRIYMYMNTDYVTAYRKPVVNAEYVKATTKRHFSEIIKLLKTSDTKEADEKYKKMIADLDGKMKETIESEERQAHNAKELADSSEDLQKLEELKSFLTERCLDDQDYDPAFLNRMIDEAIIDGTVIGVSKREAYRRLRERLRNKEKPRKPSSSKNKKDWIKEAESGRNDDPFK